MFQAAGQNILGHLDDARPSGIGLETENTLAPMGLGTSEAMSAFASAMMGNSTSESGSQTNLASSVDEDIYASSNSFAAALNETGSSNANQTESAGQTSERFENFAKSIEAPVAVTVLDAQTIQDEADTAQIRQAIIAEIARLRLETGDQQALETQRVTALKSIVKSENGIGPKTFLLAVMASLKELSKAPTLDATRPKTWLQLIHDQRKKGENGGRQVGG